MKVVFDRKELLNILAHQSLILERRNTIYILGFSLFNMGNNELTITSTDSDLVIKERIALDGAQEAVFAIPTNKILDIIRKLSDEKLLLRKLSDKDLFSIKSANGLYEFKTQPKGDFPFIEEVDFTSEMTLKASTLAKILNAVKFSMSSDEIRYYLNGVYLDIGGNTITATSTDGHRLSTYSESRIDTGDVKVDLILPRKTVNEVVKLLLEVGDTDIKISFAKGKVRFNINNVTLISKLIDGKFPDYKRVIPQDTKFSASIAISELANSIDRVISMIDDSRLRSVSLSFLSNNKLVVSSVNLGDDNAREEIDISGQIKQEEPMELIFNSRYLLDIIQQIEGTKIGCFFTNNSNAVIFKDLKNDKKLYVVMPIKS